MAFIAGIITLTHFPSSYQVTFLNTYVLEPGIPERWLKGEEKVIKKKKLKTTLILIIDKL